MYFVSSSNLKVPFTAVGTWPKKIEGIGQRDFIPAIYDASLTDEVMMVMDEETWRGTEEIGTS